MDFYQIKTRSAKNHIIEVYPDFKVRRSEDLMVRGKSFYAIWDEDRKLWSTDEYDVQAMLDKELMEHREKVAAKSDNVVRAMLMGDFSTNSWTQFRRYLSHVSDNSHQLDEDLTFANTDTKKTDYASRRLPYSVEEGSFDAFDKIIGTLYEPDERAKIEWAIGSILAGDGKDIQKFIVLYGEAGAGKSTILNIIQKLFEGYYTTFEAKALTSSNNAFSTEVFKDNPLVAIQHDGDLSRIEDNSKLNSIVSHEDMTMNEKYKPSYMARVNCFLFMASNKPVRITDAKSGIIRRLIDVSTSGKRLPTRTYQALLSQIDFELGAIANHCLEVYRSMGKDYYSTYRPLNMIFKTDTFFNFVEANLDVFNDAEGISLTQAYQMYKAYCDDSELQYKLPRHKFRDELKNYFDTFHDQFRIEGKQIRSYYTGFIMSKFTTKAKVDDIEIASSLVLDQTTSIFDEEYPECYAQYATSSGVPKDKWKDVTTRLGELNTKRAHYVKVPQNHIIIDFDLRDEKGKKSAELNIEAASMWPPTYAEFSKSKGGVHLHYLYTEDPKQLQSLYSDGIEVKTFLGGASLRRKLSKCNNVPISELKSGLPLKGEKVINFTAVKSERGLRTLVERNLRKEIHPGTKPSVDFIFTILDDAFTSGLKYDLTEMRPSVLAFANNSSNHPSECVKLVGKMKFRSEEPSAGVEEYDDDQLVFYDVEVFPNLLLICWKFAGAKNKVIRMINPSPQEVEALMRLKLIGFNCRRYDNHILYAAYLGYDISAIYELSSRIVGGSRNAYFREAYNVSYTDVYDFTIKKQSLKKYQIELGLHHQELGLPWDEPVPDDMLDDVIEYCDSDVTSLEAVFESRSKDFVARQILAQMSGLTVNDTTNAHTAKIIFGDDPHPQDQFVYTDLSEMFPGYKYERGKSTYRGEEVGEGGYVYSEPGMYGNVALLDIASMHPASIELLNLFGDEYTKNYSQLKAARLAIKHKNFDAARAMLDGIMASFLESEDDSIALSYALKLPINQVYGLTYAKFDNKFKDPRNIDNVVAKRGALFMIELKHAIQEQGYIVAHCKTDSVKIPDATPEIIEFVIEFGKKYGYDFELEAVYDKLCLVNDAVYIARHGDDEEAGEWTAIGAQFAHPYVFKTLFSHEPVTFADLCETKSVTTALYLDMNERLSEGDHDYHFVGKVGSFCPILEGRGGGLLVRSKEDKYYAATRTKGFRWLESEMVAELEKEEDIDRSYHEGLSDAAKAKISKFGDFDWFVGDLAYSKQ